MLTWQERNEKIFALLTSPAGAAILDESASSIDGDYDDNAAARTTAIHAVRIAKWIVDITFAEEIRAED